MLTIVLYKSNENKTFGTCSLSIIEIIDTQVARRGRQYHSQPSYKRQKLVPTPHPTPPGYKRQKLVAHPPPPPNPPPTKSKIVNSSYKKQVIHQKSKLRKNLTKTYFYFPEVKNISNVLKFIDKHK